MKRWGSLLMLAGVFGLVAGAAGQEVDNAIVSPYFDCPYVNYFDTDCPQLKERRPRPPAPVQPTPPEQPPVETQADEPEDDEGVRQGVLPDDLILFPRDSLAPDAPPLFRRLLANPTLENARRYVRWHARRTAQLRVVQALIQRAGEELERETQAGGPR